MTIKKTLFLMALAMLYFSVATNAQRIENKEVNSYRQQYESKLAAFRQHKLDYGEFHLLIEMDRQLTDGKLTQEIAETYKKAYLDKLSDDAALTKENLAFFALDGAQLLSTKDRYFKFLISHPALDDSILLAINSPAWNQVPSQRMNIVSRRIERIDIESKLYDAAGKPIVSPGPNFKKIEADIRKKYPEIGDRAEFIVLSAQMKFDKAAKLWADFCKAFMTRAEKFGFASVIDTQTGRSDPNWAFPNQLTETIVRYCVDPQLLAKASQWEREYIVSYLEDRGKHWIDGELPDCNISWQNDFMNYAGLLYKSGKCDEAIIWAELQVKLIKTSLDQGYTGTLDLKKMYKQKLELLSRMTRGDKIDETWEARWFY